MKTSSPFHVAGRAIGSFLWDNRSAFIGAALLFGALALPSLVDAQTVNVFGNSQANVAGVDSGGQDIAIIVYRCLKVAAIIVGGLGVWRLLEHDYKWMMACFACFCVLFFMPSIVEVAQSIGRNVFQQSHTT